MILYTIETLGADNNWNEVAKSTDQEQQQATYDQVKDYYKKEGIPMRKNKRGSDATTP